jgi:hypothetical protein
MRKGLSTSFSFSPEFKDYLEKLAAGAGKTKTQIIQEAVNMYSAGDVFTEDVRGKLAAVLSNQLELADSLDEIRTLCLQILKNQQGES